MGQILGLFKHAQLPVSNLGEERETEFSGTKVRLSERRRSWQLKKEDVDFYLPSPARLSERIMAAALSTCVI